MASRTTDILIEEMSESQGDSTIKIAREEEAEIAIRDAKTILKHLGAQCAIESDYGVERRGQHIVIFDTFCQKILLKGEASTNQIIINNIEGGMCFDLGQHAYALDVGGTSSFKAACPT